MCPRVIADSDDRVAMLDSTTGSRVGLADEAEVRLPVVWLAAVLDGRLSRWPILEDAPSLRRDLGLRPQTLPGHKDQSRVWYRGRSAREREQPTGDPLE